MALSSLDTNLRKTSKPPAVEIKNAEFDCRRQVVYFPIFMVVTTVMNLHFLFLLACCVTENIFKIILSHRIFNYFYRNTSGYVVVNLLSVLIDLVIHHVP